jgi:ppGpp synthetase/RelA/SpoT-type nucleotidyltranferase
VVLSGSQRQKLGKRLAKADKISDADLTLLEQVLGEHQPVRDRIARVLAEAGVVNEDGNAPTSRIKTTDTLVAKLRRNPSMSLTTVQDIVGFRVLVPAGSGRNEQDGIVRTIIRALEANGFVATIIDRRAKPSSGYRAVHLVADVDSMHCEIQVRTRWQQQWAELVEKLGDFWGRGIRYGDLPIDPHEPAVPGSTMSRAEAFEAVQQVSEAIDVLESAQQVLSRAPVHLVPPGVVESLTVAEEKLEQVLATVRSAFVPGMVES